MRVVARAASREAHLDPALLVAMDFLVPRRHNDDALHLRIRQVDTRVEGGHDRNGAPHAAEPIRITRSTFGTGARQAIVGLAPFVQRKQAHDAVVQRLWQVVFGVDLQLGHHEFTLLGSMRAEFRMPFHGNPLPDIQVTHPALGLEMLGLVLAVLHAQGGQLAVVSRVIARMGRVDQVLVQAGGEPVPIVALVVVPRDRYLACR